MNHRGQDITENTDLFDTVNVIKAGFSAYAGAESDIPKPGIISKLQN